MKMKLQSLMLALAFIIPFANVQAQQQGSEPQQTSRLFIKWESDQAGKRYGAGGALDVEFLAALGTRFQQRYKDPEKAKAEIRKETFNLIAGIGQFISTTNVFWKGDELQKTVVKNSVLSHMNRNRKSLHPKDLA